MTYKIDFSQMRKFYLDNNFKKIGIMIGCSFRNEGPES